MPLPISIVGMVASHVDDEDRLKALRRCLRSIVHQRVPLQKFFISFSGLLHAEAALTVAEEMCGMLDVSTFHVAKVHSQFEHYQALTRAVRGDRAIPSDNNVVCLFGDDDDIWHPERVAVYAELLARRPHDVDGLSLEWAAMPCAACAAEVLQSVNGPASVDAMLRHGQADVKQMSCYCMIACKVEAVSAFFDQCPAPLVQCKFCDIAFKNFMLERRQCVRFTPESHEGQSFVTQGKWLFFYDNIHDASSDADEAELFQLKRCTSPSEFFGSGHHLKSHASDIRSCSPEEAERQIVRHQLPNLHRVNRELTDGGPDMVARHLARHRTRIEKESAGWFGRALPPSRTDVETLFHQIELGSGGTSALAALIGSMRRQALDNSRKRRRSARMSRAYLSYDDLADLEKASSEMSAQEQAVAFDCMLLRAAQPLRKILLRFGMDTEAADLFEAQLERMWQARCEHLARV